MNRFVLPLLIFVCACAAYAVPEAPGSSAGVDKPSVQAAILAKIDLAEARMEEFNSLYAQCQAKGVRLDYPTVAKTMLEQFIPLAREDAKAGIEWRAEYAVRDFNRTLDDSIAEMKAYLADPTLAPVARRYVTSNVRVDGLSLVADRLDENGKRDRGPVFLCGYGHFAQLQVDMPRWPGYGVSKIQCSQLGPRNVFPADGQVDLSPVRTLAETLDHAARRNVSVDFLVSPHLFPNWAKEKWPQLATGGSGSIRYCMDAPEAKQLIEKYMRIVLPAIKDKPALGSICLTNEPSLKNIAGFPNTKPTWVDYLTKAHGDIRTVNERYGTSYASFADVPMPGDQEFDAPQYYDWFSFKAQRFIAWHKWMADVCRELAPNIPLHAKIKCQSFLNRNAIVEGVSPEMFGELCDMNGNDCFFVGTGGPGWRVAWQTQDICYDIQRSLNRKPIFNSENHPSTHDSTAYIAPEHFRACLWLGALHGQDATTIWLWQRTNDPKSNYWANAMDRPGCVEAVGKTCLDLNRFADEMTALQNVKSPVAILWSTASLAKCADYVPNLKLAYTALNFLGLKVDFISDKQLAEGKGAQYKMIVLPNAANVLDSTVSALKGLPESVRIVWVGDNLTRDEYGRARDASQVDAVRGRAMVFKAGADAEKVLWPALRAELGKLRALPEIRVVDAGTGEVPWGVEWLPVKFRGRDLVSIVNLSSKPVTVSVVRGGSKVEARDLLSLGGRERVGKARPAVPVLAEVGQARP